MRLHKILVVPVVALALVGATGATASAATVRPASLLPICETFKAYPSCHPTTRTPTACVHIPYPTFAKQRECAREVVVVRG